MTVVPVKAKLGNELVMDEYYKLENKKINGIKYNHVGSRQGLGSMLDSNLIEQNLQRQRDLMGDGYIKFARLDANGNVITKSSTMNLEGRLIKSDEKGAFLIVDGKSLQKIKERELERRNYIEQVTSDCSVSDEIAAMSLGMSVDELIRQIGANGLFRRFNGLKIDPAIIAVDATPSAIATYDPNSITYSQAIRKLKMIVEDVFPMVQTLTNEETIKHGDENTG